MERLVGIPIEIALNGMPGLEDLRSTSIAGLTDVKCQFCYDTDYWKARQEVINRLTRSRTCRKASIPMLSPWSPTGEIVRYVLEGPGYTLNEIKAVQDWVVQRALKTVPGVIDVTGFGGTVKQYLVLVDPMELNHYSITLQQVQDAIQKSNANVSGNILTLGSQSHIVRGIGLLGKGDRSTRAGQLPIAPAGRQQARRYPQRRRRLSTRAIRSWSATSPRSSKGTSRGWVSSAGAQPERKRRRRRHRAHAQVRKIDHRLRRRQGENRRDPKTGHPAARHEDHHLQRAQRAGERDQA